MTAPLPPVAAPLDARRLRIGAAPALLRAVPHLPAFRPDAETVALGRRRAIPDMEWVPVAGAATAGALPLRFSEGPFPAPSFGRRRAPVILFAAPGASGDPLAAVLAAALARPPAHAAARADARVLRERIAELRVGGIPGLPDPGPVALGCGRGEAVIVLDPCDPSRAPATQRLWRDAAARAAGRPLRVVRSPSAAPEAAATLATTLPSRLAPWTLVEAAAELHLLDDPLAPLALLAGVAVPAHASTPLAPWMSGGQRDGLDLLSALAAAARCVDPFRREPCDFAQALALLGDWRRMEDANRRIAVCAGMSFWKRRRVTAALASTRGAPACRTSAAAALAVARRQGGAIAVWTSRVPRGLPDAAARAGIPLVWVEDGFIRSSGLGAGFLPGASFVADARAPYYDPTVETELEALLASARFTPALLARAEALVATLRARAITKYNLGGPAPALPARDGRPRILVPGQVADDLSVLRGATGEVRDDRALLAAARAAEPGAFIIYKPHPDVVAGYRRGGVPEREARAHADLVLPAAPMAALLDEVDAVHTLTSLTGFEALIRGVAVTTWGQPFYAGWGLTEDRVPFARRTRRLRLAELVAGALILHPRYIDPVTELPCPPESLLDRLSEPGPWRAGPLMRMRRWQGRAMAALGRVRDGWRSAA